MQSKLDSVTSRPSAESTIFSDTGIEISASSDLHVQSLSDVKLPFQTQTVSSGADLKYVQPAHLRKQTMMAEEEEPSTSQHLFHVVQVTPVDETDRQAQASTLPYTSDNREHMLAMQMCSDSDDTSNLVTAHNQKRAELAAEEPTRPMQDQKEGFDLNVH